jgi:hypothetical protein
VLGGAQRDVSFGLWCFRRGFPHPKCLVEFVNYSSAHSPRRVLWLT